MTTAVYTYQRHELSAAYGDMDAYTYARMGESMAETDYESMDIQPEVTIFEGKVLDGWHRYTWCEQLDIAPAFRVFTGTYEQARKFCRIQNLYRRQLTQAQRAAMYLEAHDTDDRALTVKQQADEAEVSKRTLELVRVGIRAGYGRQLVAGEMSAQQAYELAREKDGETRERRPSKAERLQVDLDRARAEVSEKSNEIGELRHQLLVANNRVDILENHVPVSDDVEIARLRERVANLTQSWDRAQKAVYEARQMATRRRDHIEALEELALGGDVTRLDVEALRREYAVA